MKNIILLLFVSAFMSSCYFDKYEELYPLANYVNDCDTTLATTYSSSVSMIINNNCISCHNNKTKNGNLDLSSYSLVVNSVNSGRFVGAIQHNTGYYAMPPNVTLQPCEINRINSWIQQNLPN
ncbi:MAG TPA: hypothetical protein VK766_07955 [Cytophagaceae bacterium]|jgi:hypothetical protein|nr:hypothetical protein [Cytophagaceae bacterium]